MKKILIAVDDTKGSKAAVSTCVNTCKCIQPEEVLLVYVEKFEGRSLMDDMLGEAELSTLKDVLEGTEYKERLDAKASAVLDFYKNALQQQGINGVTTVVRYGHPAEEILRTASEEAVNMIIIGSRGKRVSNLFMGSVSREVADGAEVPVLIIK